MNNELRSALWFAGAGIAVLVTVVIGMKLKSAEAISGGQLPGRPGMYAPGGWRGNGGGQNRGQMAQAAAFSPGCVTCPNFTQCFPNATAGQGGQLAAFQLQKTTTLGSPIFRDAQMPHEFRGVCENCHEVKPDIPIKASAQLPHTYRGVCSNCHAIVGTAAGAF
jgi:hypothetical protein